MVFFGYIGSCFLAFAFVLKRGTSTGRYYFTKVTQKRLYHRAKMVMEKLRH